MKLILGKNQLKVLELSMVLTSANGYATPQTRKVANQILEQIKKKKAKEFVEREVPNPKNPYPGGIIE